MKKTIIFLKNNLSKIATTVKPVCKALIICLRNYA